MKNKKLLALVLATVFAMGMMLTACGPKTLEAYYNSDSDFKSQIDSIADGQEGLSIDFDENTVIYTYDVADMIPSSASDSLMNMYKSALKDALDDAAGQFESLAAQMEEEAEVEGVKIHVIYTLGDEVLAENTFSAKK